MPKPPGHGTAPANSALAQSAWRHQIVEDGPYRNHLGVHFKKCSTGPLESSAQALALDSSCQAWLLAWEVRQERLLQRHEEAMRLQVESLRRELQQGRQPREPRVSRLDSAASNLVASFRSDRSRTTPKSGEEDAIPEEVDVVETSKSAAQGRAGSAAHVVPRKSRMEPEMPKSSRLRSRAFALVHCKAFSVASSVMIFLYTLAVGAMAEVEMSSALEGKEEPFWLWHVDFVFAASFTVEVLLRALSDGSVYLLGAERNWNVFDSCVALVGVADVCLGMHINMGFLRILRACRVVRVLRVLKGFHALRDLRLMVESLMACVPCLGWGLVLLGFLKYIFAVVLLRGTQQSVREGSLSAAAQVVVRESFSGMQGALLSLTQAISGGRSWGEYLAPFEEVSMVLGLLFPAFMLFVIFGALNILTGIFVETTNSIAKQNRDLAVEEMIAQERHAEAQIQDFFEELDADGSGTLSIEELAHAVQDPRLKAYFSVLEINAEDTGKLFHMLDEQKTGAVTMEHFIEKCQALRGSAKAMDVAEVLKESAKMQREFKALMRTVEGLQQKAQRPTRVKTRNLKTLSDYVSEDEPRGASKMSCQSEQ